MQKKAALGDNNQMKIGFICDIHMPESKNSPQYAFFMRAIEQMQKDGIRTVINLGDITAYGEENVMADYVETMKCFDSYYVLGNAEVRNPETAVKICSLVKDVQITAGNRRLIGINTPYGEITQKDKERLADIKDGDILFMHHGPYKMNRESVDYITKLAEKNKLTLIHGHSHKWFDYKIGESRVIGLRALDPDKSIGDFPCITYIDVADEEISIEEKLFDVDKDVIMDVRKFFGLSCVDNHRDVVYATENGVRFIELRCNGTDWQPDMTLLPKLKLWRERTKGYLSVHMPNLKWTGTEIKGEEQWYQAVDYAVKVGADGLTMHPPRIRKPDMPENGIVWKKYIDLYTYAVKNMSEDVMIGIENIHMSKAERGLDEAEKCFGYSPKEVSAWIDAINKAIGKFERVGHVLDVGHARNNGGLSSKYPSSRWYEIMGKKTVAYHIHQVISSDDGLKNHNAIEDWFGPLISYVSFFYAWGENMINHVPVFLEVRGTENYEKSINAFENVFVNA